MIYTEFAQYTSVLDHYCDQMIYCFIKSSRSAPQEDDMFARAMSGAVDEDIVKVPNFILV